MLSICWFVEGCVTVVSVNGGSVTWEVLEDDWVSFVSASACVFRLFVFLLCSCVVVVLLAALCICKCGIVELVQRL